VAIESQRDHCAAHLGREPSAPEGGVEAIEQLENRRLAERAEAGEADGLIAG
jgi:hypothetical protein